MQSARFTFIQVQDKEMTRLYLQILEVKLSMKIYENTLFWFLDKEFWRSTKKNEGQAKLSYKIIHNDDNDEHGFLQRLPVFCQYLQVNPMSIYFQ